MIESTKHEHNLREQLRKILKNSEIDDSVYQMITHIRRFADSLPGEEQTKRFENISINQMEEDELKEFIKKLIDEELTLPVIMGKIKEEKEKLVITTDDENEICSQLTTNVKKQIIKQLKIKYSLLVKENMLDELKEETTKRIDALIPNPIELTITFRGYKYTLDDSLKLTENTANFTSKRVEDYIKLYNEERLNDFIKNILSSYSFSIYENLKNGSQVDETIKSIVEEARSYEEFLKRILETKIESDIQNFINSRCASDINEKLKDGYTLESDGEFHKLANLQGEPTEKKSASITLDEIKKILTQKIVADITQVKKNSKNKIEEILDNMQKDYEIQLDEKKVSDILFENFIKYIKLNTPSKLISSDLKKDIETRIVEDFIKSVIHTSANKPVEILKNIDNDGIVRINDILVPMKFVENLLERVQNLLEKVAINGYTFLANESNVFYDSDNNKYLLPTQDIHYFGLDKSENGLKKIFNYLLSKTCITNVDRNQLYRMINSINMLQDKISSILFPQNFESKIDLLTYFIIKSNIRIGSRYEYHSAELLSEIDKILIEKRIFLGIEFVNEIYKKNYDQILREIYNRLEKNAHKELIKLKYDKVFKLQEKLTYGHQIIAEKIIKSTIGKFKYEEFMSKFGSDVIKNLSIDKIDNEYIIFNDNQRSNMVFKIKQIDNGYIIKNNKEQEICTITYEETIKVLLKDKNYDVTITPYGSVQIRKNDDYNEIYSFDMNKDTISSAQKETKKANLFGLIQLYLSNRIIDINQQFKESKDDTIERTLETFYSFNIFKVYDKLLYFDSFSYRADLENLYIMDLQNYITMYNRFFSQNNDKKPEVGIICEFSSLGEKTFVLFEKKVESLTRFVSVQSASETNTIEASFSVVPSLIGFGGKKYKTLLGLTKTENKQIDETFFNVHTNIAKEKESIGKLLELISKFTYVLRYATANTNTKQNEQKTIIDNSEEIGLEIMIDRTLKGVSNTLLWLNSISNEELAKFLREENIKEMDAIKFKVKIYMQIRDNCKKILEYILAQEIEILKKEIEILEKEKAILKNTKETPKKKNLKNKTSIKKLKEDIKTLKEEIEILKKENLDKDKNGEETLEQENLKKEKEIFEKEKETVLRIINNHKYTLKKYINISFENTKVIQNLLDSITEDGNVEEVDTIINSSINQEILYEAIKKLFENMHPKGKSAEYDSINKTELYEVIQKLLDSITKDGNVVELDGIILNNVNQEELENVTQKLFKNINKEGKDKKQNGIIPERITLEVLYEVIQKLLDSITKDGKVVELDSTIFNSINPKESYEIKKLKNKLKLIKSLIVDLPDYMTINLKSSEIKNSSTVNGITELLRCKHDHRMAYNDHFTASTLSINLSYYRQFLFIEKKLRVLDLYINYSSDYKEKIDVDKEVNVEVYQEKEYFLKIKKQILKEEKELLKEKSTIVNNSRYRSINKELKKVLNELQIIANKKSTIPDLEEISKLELKEIQAEEKDILNEEVKIFTEEKKLLEKEMSEILENLELLLIIENKTESNIVIKKIIESLEKRIEILEKEREILNTNRTLLEKEEESAEKITEIIAKEKEISREIQQLRELLNVLISKFKQPVIDYVNINGLIKTIKEYLEKSVLIKEHLEKSVLIKEHLEKNISIKDNKLPKAELSFLSDEPEEKLQKVDIIKENVEKYIERKNKSSNITTEDLQSTNITEQQTQYVEEKTYPDDKQQYYYSMYDLTQMPKTKYLRDYDLSDDGNIKNSSIKK